MRYQTFSDMNFKDHHLTDIVWSVEASTPGKTYDVALTGHGFTCNCVAGSMRGKCKHAQQIHDQLVSDDYELPKDEF